MASYLYPTERKLIIVTVISDLVTDNRVHKVCQTLHEAGYRVLLIGSLKKESLSLQPRDYETDRLKLWFKRSALFYLEFNIRLFFRLLKQPADIYLGNDLDIMPATLCISMIKKKPLVYDSHEYFLGQAGLEKKPLRRNIWALLEKRVFVRLKYMYTVSESIRNLYRRDYNLRLSVVRNLPMAKPSNGTLSESEKLWIVSVDQLIPKNKHMLLLQGAGLNADRGAEELVYSMLFLDPARFHLLIVGGGDVFEKLKIIIDQNQLNDRVTLVAKVPFNVLSHFTKKADLGLSIDKATVINHRFSLSNKLFEYLHAGVPVLASRLVEQEKIINQYQVGDFIDDHHPEHIADKIREIFTDPEQLIRWKTNTKRVREELNWENESKIVVDIFKQVEKDTVNY